MTWQDELRRLEDDLVNGRVSAEDYRIRRDQLLTSANSSPQQAYQQTNLDNTQIIPPVTDGAAPQQQQYPQQQPQQQFGQGDDPDRTQTVRPGQLRQTYGGYQGQQFDDPDRTQFVPGNQTGSQTGNQTGNQDRSEEPPWHGSEIPPLMGGGSNSWVKQGPEDGSQKGTRVKILAVVGGVVVVALLAVGAYFLFSGSSGNNPNPQAGGQQANSQQPGGGGQAPASPTADPNKDLGIIDPLGESEDHRAVQTLDGLQRANYLNPGEIQAYTNAVTTRVVFKVGKDNTVTVVLVGAQASTPDGAKAAAKVLNSVQLRNGMQPMSGELAKGVYVAELHKKGAQPEIRAHYAHGTTIVRVHVYGASYGAVRADFQKTLNAQLKSLSADD